MLRWRLIKLMQAYGAAGFKVVDRFAFPKRYRSRSRYVRYQHECGARSNCRSLTASHTGLYESASSIYPIADLNYPALSSWA
jgi:hypothetical protein